MSDSLNTNPPRSRLRAAPDAEQTMRTFDTVTYSVIVVFIGILFATVSYRALSDVRRDSNRTPTLVPYVGTLSDADHAIINQASDILARAEAAQSSAERVLNFLEGASILIGGALAIAAVYGFRNAQETRNELEKELRTLTSLRDKLLADIRSEQKNVEDRVALKFDREARRLTGQSQDIKRDLESKVADIRREQSTIDDKFDQLFERNAKAAADIDNSLPLLQKLPSQLTMLSHYQETLNAAQAKIDRLEALSQDLDARIENIMFALSDLIQANQELILHNHDEAYANVLHVLERMPDNALALYIAGWIEFQYLENKFENGLKRMARAYTLAPENPTIMAAYGVVLRRQAVQTDGTLREQLFTKAEALLLEALCANPRLLDLNQESFWGPIAGLRRDQGRLKDALKAYENAVLVTPGSSYPRGNLAALYLCQHRAQGDDDSRDRALHHFEQTLTYAQHELAAFSDDYFHLMDIAMARVILGYNDPAHLKAAHRQLDDVLALRPTVEMLQTSRRGWYFLYHATPESWADVRRVLMLAIKKIEAKIIHQGGIPLAIDAITLCGETSQETDNDAA